MESKLLGGHSAKWRCLKSFIVSAPNPSPFTLVFHSLPFPQRPDVLAVEGRIWSCGNFLGQSGPPPGWLRLAWRGRVEDAPTCHDRDGMLECLELRGPSCSFEPDLTA